MQVSAVAKSSGDEVKTAIPNMEPSRIEWFQLAQKLYRSLSNYACESIRKYGATNYATTLPPQPDSVLFSAFFVRRLAEIPQLSRELVTSLPLPTSSLLHGAFRAVQMLHPFIGLPLHVSHSSSGVNSDLLYKVIAAVQQPKNVFRLVLAPWWRTAIQMAYLVVEYTVQNTFDMNLNGSLRTRALAHQLVGASGVVAEQGQKWSVDLWINYQVLFDHHSLDPAQYPHRHHNMMIGPLQIRLETIEPVGETECTALSLLDEDMQRKLTRESYQRFIQLYVLDSRWHALLSSCSRAAADSRQITVEFFAACLTTVTAQDDSKEVQFSSPMPLLMHRGSIKTSNKCWKQLMSLEHGTELLPSAATATATALTLSHVQCPLSPPHHHQPHQSPSPSTQNIATIESYLNRHTRTTEQQQDMIQRILRRWQAVNTTYIMETTKTTTWGATLSHLTLRPSSSLPPAPSSSSSSTGLSWVPMEPSQSSKVEVSMNALHHGFWKYRIRHKDAAPETCDEFIHLSTESGTGKKLAVLTALTAIGLNGPPHLVVTTRWSIARWLEEIRVHFKPKTFTYLVANSRTVFSRPIHANIVFVTRHQVRQESFMTGMRKQLKNRNALKTITLDQCDELKSAANQQWIAALRPLRPQLWIFLSRPLAPGSELSWAATSLYTLPRTHGIRDSMFLETWKTEFDESKKSRSRSGGASSSRSRSRSHASGSTASPIKKRRKTVSSTFVDQEKVLFYQCAHRYWWYHILCPRILLGTLTGPSQGKNAGGLETRIQFVTSVFATSKEAFTYRALLQFYAHFKTHKGEAEMDYKTHLLGLTTGTDYTSISHSHDLERDVQEINQRRREFVPRRRHLKEVKSMVMADAWSAYHDLFPMVDKETWSELLEAPRLYPIQKDIKEGELIHHPKQIALPPYEAECPICMDKAAFPVIAPCTHLFCLKCLLTWISMNRTTCPLCREENIQLDSLQRLPLNHQLAIDSHPEEVRQFHHLQKSWTRQDERKYKGSRSKLDLLHKYILKRLVEITGAILVCFESKKQLEIAEKQLRQDVTLSFHCPSRVDEVTEMMDHGIRLFLWTPESFSQLIHLNSWFQEVIVTSPIPGPWSKTIDLLSHRNGNRRHGFDISYITLLYIKDTHEEFYQQYLSQQLPPSDHKHEHIQTQVWSWISKEWSSEPTRWTAVPVHREDGVRLSPTSFLSQVWQQLSAM